MIQISNHLELKKKLKQNLRGSIPRVTSDKQLCYYKQKEISHKKDRMDKLEYSQRRHGAERKRNDDDDDADDDDDDDDDKTDDEIMYGE